MLLTPALFSKEGVTAVTGVLFHYNSVMTTVDRVTLHNSV
jgi:hypothetical protein